MAEVASGDREAGDAFGFMISSMIGSFAPISFSQSDKGFLKSSMKSVVPTALKPFFEIAMNENHYGTTIYKENFPVGTPVPESELGRRTTPEAFKMTSRFLNEAFGGSEYVSSGIMDINPDKIYHVFNFAIGGTGKFITNIGETGKALSDKSKGIPTELEARKIPFIRKIMGEPNRYSDVSDYYERRSEVGQLFEELKAGFTDFKKGVADSSDIKVKDYINSLSASKKKRYEGVIKLKAYSDEYDKAFKKYRQLTKIYEKIEDPIEKAQKLNKIEEKVDSYIDKWNKLYKNYFQTEKEPTN